MVAYWGGLVVVAVWPAAAAGATCRYRETEGRALGRFPTVRTTAVEAVAAMADHFRRDWWSQAGSKVR